MKVRVPYLLLFPILILSGCFENEQDLYICDDFQVVVEEMPQPVGGIAEIQRSVEYPEEAREAGIEGRVTVQLIVNKIGRAVNPRVIRGIGGGCDEAAIKAIEKAKFKPGKQNGKPVCVRFALSINFRLQN